MRLNRLTALAIGIALALPLVASAREVLPFIKDDYAGAVAQARAKNVPIFAEAWAPW